jgi:alkylated DNA repair protein (DNA oxidative demethylase)
MSVSMMNCGAWGRIADRRGYRDTTDDPATGSPWPAMPDVFARLAAWLLPNTVTSILRRTPASVNRYETGAPVHPPGQERR